MNNRAIQNLTLQLQKSLDTNYDVIDMQTVLFVIQQLENTTITKEQLETTRLAKYINELRRRTSSETLARRAKSLLKKWRDIFMPTIQQQQQQQQQQSAVASSSAIRNDASASTICPSQTTKQQQVTIGASSNANANNNNSSLNSSSSYNKVLTGSANNNRNNSLSNGGFSQQQQQQQQQKQSIPMEPKIDMLRPRGTQIVSPMMGPIVSGSTLLMIDRKQNYSAQSVAQPISFANVLSTTQALKTGAASNPSVFSHFSSNSPLPHITQNVGHQRHNQSPTTLLDFDSNSSRPQTTASRSRTLINGEHNATMGASNVAGDLHDSNSVVLDIAGAAVGASCPVDDLQSSQLLTKMYSTQSVTTADICSSSSSHRKSKKHKKDKKRNKQSPDKPPPTSETALQVSQPKLPNIGQGSVPFLNPYAGETQPPVGEEETHNTVGAGTVFPPHDSLSSSSMSRFPSNISTNTMTIQHNCRIQTNSEACAEPVETRQESDLTFAGKFKSSCNAGIGIVNDDVALPALMKSYSDSKDSSDVVVVESRSCSPFTTVQMGADDSCSSSSRATLTAETINLNPDSNQDAPVDAKGALSQRIPQSLVGQQDPGLSCNSSQVIAAVGTTTVAGPEQQPPEAVAPAPKKRGRKKGSRGFDAVIAQTHAFLNASMFERPRMLLGSKKVKTTKELLADIQNRKLGSSATSSPTLTSRQSISPSTCSEASFQSDLTSTRASMPNPRLSPELGTMTNCRQSDIDDVTSATESNDAGKLPAVNDSTQANKSAAKLSSLDEYLNNLTKQLPPVETSKLEHFIEHTVLCTCSIREAEPATASAKEEVVIIKSDDESDGMKARDVPFDVGKSWTQKPTVETEKSLSVANGSGLDPVIAPAPPSLKKSPKKPVKSIFDLDYDEENDPLHSFVEAAKLRVSEKAAEEQATALVAIDQNNSGNVCDANTGKETQISGELVPSLTAATSNQQPPSQQLPPKSIVEPTAVSNAGFFDNALVPDPNATIFPLYEAVEDANCPAKYRYEVQTNCITEYHINVLHNCFVPCVNGNWSGPIAMTSDHSKELQKYWLNSSKEPSTSESNPAFSKQISWWITDTEFAKKLRLENEPSDDEHLFERVVPQYDHIIMDKVIKNLSHVKFTKNYMKKKLKRLKIEAEKMPAKPSLVAGNDGWQTGSGSLGSASESKKVKKRKRTRTTSTSYDQVHEDGDAEKKHKHQRRKKHRKVRDSDLEGNTHVDISLSRQDVKDAVDKVDVTDMNSGNGEANTESEILSSENSKPNRCSSDTENTCDVELAARPTADPQSESKDLLENNTLEPMVEFSYSSVDLSVHLKNKDASTEQSRSEYNIPGQDDSHRRHNCDPVNKTDDHIREPNAVEATLIESFNNNSNRRTSNVNNSSDKVKENNQLSPSVVTPILNEDESTNSRDFSCNSAESMDHYADEEYGDDYFEDDHVNNEEHEVVTHDMTSSTSTTSQQHIVLTIKKKIPKSASSHVHSDGNNDDATASPHASPANSEQDSDQLSIVTSSSTPTTITIRRKNKQQQQNRQQQKSGQDTDQQLENHFPEIALSDINGNPTTTSGNSVRMPGTPPTGEHETHTTRDPPLLGPSDGAESHSEPINFVGNDIDSASANSNDNHKPSFEDSVSVQLEQLSESLPVASPKKDTLESDDLNCERQLQPTEQVKDENDEATNENNAQQCDDHDLSDKDDATCDNDQSQLLKENNGLLESFNELRDDNICGLRVLQKLPMTKEHSLASDASNTSNAAAPPLPLPLATAAPTSSSSNVPDDNQLVQEFKEWHEVLQVPSYNEEILTILPYVVID